MTATASTGGKLIALTFDDGPGAYTNRLLDGLAQRGVKVTFFVQGKNAAAYPNTIKRIYDEGHQLASHTYDHPTLTSKTNSEIAWQLNRTAEILNKATGTTQSYVLRPPYGDCNSRVLSAIGTPAIIWSVDPADWRDRNANTVCTRIVSGAFDGAIVLAHDIHSTTVDGALKAIDQLLAKGYEFVTVNELHRRRGVTLQNGVKHYSCKPTGVDYGPVAVPEITLERTYGQTKACLTSSEGAKIYYTTDGSTPTANSKVYTAPFVVELGQTVKAIAAYNFNGDRSKEASLKIDVLPLQIPAVERTETGVKLLNPNADSDIRYTTNSADPITAGAVYQEEIPYFDGTLRFLAMGEGSRSESRTIYVSKNGNLFWDVSSSAWYFSGIDRAVTLGLMSGVSEYRMDPNGALSRAMFLTLLYRLQLARGETPFVTAETDFTDVKRDQWYSEAITWATMVGIAQGYPDGKFYPNQSITREEMCVALDRFLTAEGIEAQEASLDFEDAQMISQWARDGVAHLVTMGLVMGKTHHRFVPRDTATRAEAAILLLRLYDYMETT